MNELVVKKRVLSETVWNDAFCFVADNRHLISLPAEVYSIAYVPFRTSVRDSVVIAAVAMAISFLATLYPSAQAARLEPVETLRYE